MSSTISLTFPDGAERQYAKGVTAAEIAADISTSLAKRAISAAFDDRHWDLQWPIERDGRIGIHTMQDETPALELIRHSLAHIMASAVQELWPDTKVTIGPVIRHGWYYDFDRDQPFTPEDLKVIEVRMRQIINRRERVSSEVWPRDRVIDFYRNAGEPFKIELVEAIPGDQPIRMYWHGDWQDLCRGPHLQHTGQVPADAFSLQSVAGAYWRGDSRNKMLQRIYGIAFRRKQDLQQHVRMIEEAQRRDHRRIGVEMQLFHFQEEAPGMAFWHPNGWTVYKLLKEYMSRRQQQNGYVEVNTPLVVDRTLWEASGHWEKFQEHMFLVDVEAERGEGARINALKPMNCPCHVQIYNRGQRSYRELPLRMAEFGSCNRFEPSGALHGLMRVRGFVQDDAHIFCKESQIESETASFIRMLSTIYADLGFESFRVKFADRPQQRAGSDSVWDRAEHALQSATEAAGCEFELNPGEGAFYGPKLEFVLTDAIGRDWQCGTLQVDFVLPERLDANYVGSDGEKHRPVILHRAILGSFERFIGILIENHAGRLPFWLTPRQVVVATIVSAADGYAQEVTRALLAAGIRAEADCRNEKINYKVREHSLAKVPVVIALGEREVREGTVSVRRLGEKQLQTAPLIDVLSGLKVESLPPDLRRSGTAPY
ncbi:MAG: threonine--tRNA ligase [Rhodobacteraceae bacterium]|nr:threonine--tRNA ligase [Paracoccaceae bacterium]